ncbi:hypothetical protein BU24DRAFT_422170 [Aaosphaeria arxii CBS 175.79]|uniref:DUF7707 domain-containing protein n=1 Tax=Aaosphaeria arxii CBS 175.79 TaxID=1450172 RepID=A0A6A5XSI6_9PLEO|nr:uncharacterized protein BU24DRAFT_422170 [Aaosphaeria arxii CBS 175.79]KAF2015866.1 hypothetical protein BU24DRAFT_422170 [Aaosphaeria arxii CBS 175.79]
MRYSSVFVAVSALASFAVAQNETSQLPPTIQPCCTVDPQLISSTNKTNWCLAERNTCREACDNQVAAGGNTCDNNSLEFECKCRNGTDLDMKQYEQSVPGQMCRFWYDQCVAATNEDLDQQKACEAARDANCGTQLTNGDTTSSSASSSEPTSSPTSTGGSSESATSAGAVPATSSPGLAPALAYAREYSTPLMAGGLVALFGFAL